MSDSSVWLLLGTALSIGVVHTLVGVDHYLPFVVMGRARSWPLSKTLGLTAVCALGHVAASVVLGVLGIGLGVALERLTWIEGLRGEWAAWILIGFGLGYAVYSLVQTSRGRAHTHPHVHPDGTLHTHPHSHQGEHLHPHQEPGMGRATAWSLFVIFILGPCEPLIPVLMAPAASRSWWLVVAVAVVFGGATVLTMVGMALLGSLGLRGSTFGRLEPHMGALAGLAIASSGVAIQVLGI